MAPPPSDEGGLVRGILVALPFGLLVWAIILIPIMLLIGFFT